MSNHRERKPSVEFPFVEDRGPGVEGVPLGAAANAGELRARLMKTGKITRLRLLPGRNFIVNAKVKTPFR